jgi:hypothetical protein
VHIAWGGAFLERLRPDEAREHLAAVRRVLVPGGEYLCTGDSPRELGRRLREAGFSRVRFYAGMARVPRAALGLVPASGLRVCAVK